MRADRISRRALRLGVVLLALLALLLAQTGASSAQQAALQVTPLSGTSVVGTTHTLTATVTPSSAALLVRFSIAAGPNAGSAGAALTNAQGVATLSYVGAGGAGTDTILLWVDFDGVEGGDEPLVLATKTWTAGGQVTSIVLSPQSDSNPVGTSHSLTATVSPPQDDIVVRFEVLNGPNGGVKRSDETNNSGVATASYTGSGGAGIDAIIAWADLDNDAILDSGEPAAVATKTWTASGGPSIVSLQPGSDSNPVGTSHELTARISPAKNNVLVRFEVLSGPNAGDKFADRTNSSGVAVKSYVGDGGAGSDTIIAWADLDEDGNRDAGEATLTATKTWVAAGGGVVASISLTPESDSNPTGTVHQLTATVSPAISNVRVRFEVLSGPNAGDTRSDDTNSSGVARQSYTGDGGSGVDTIIAWADLDRDGRRDGNEPVDLATKTWTGPGPVISIALSPASDENLVGTRHSLTATVAPVQNGVLVRFEVFSGPNDGVTRSDSTNSSGVASASYDGNGGAGTDTIVAWADLDRDGNRDPAEPTAIASKTWNVADVLGTFIQGTVPRSGIALIVWGGGNGDLLASASSCGSLRSSVRYWVSQVSAGRGEWIIYVPASEVSAVNARWFARFPAGFLPRGTVLLATCGG